MRRAFTLGLALLTGLAVLAGPIPALAQEDPGAAPGQSDDPGELATEGAAESTAEAPAVVAAPPATPLEQPMEAPRRDGPRFRGAIAFTGGGEFFSDFEYSAVLFGVDGRVGVQINDLIGVYVAPHLSLGGERGSGASGITSTFAVMAMADFTLLDSLFVGAGAGYMVFNAPNGPALGFRVGGYPVKSVSKTGPRRRGLVLSLETRIGFMGSNDGHGVQVMGAIGYEKY